MITDEGILLLKRYFGGEIGTIASSIAFGLGSATPTAADTALQFEYERAEVSLTAYDFANNKLVFKCIIPPEFSGKIYEVGLFTMEIDDLAGDFGSRLLVSFDSETEDWTNATWVTTSNRIGLDSLRHAPAASASVTSALADIFVDFSGNSGADKFVLAYNNGNANCASIRVRLKTDDSNYYDFTISNPATGYQISTVTKGSLTVTGAPSWENIVGVEVTTTAKAGGAASVELDGLRIEDVDTSNPDYVMVSREVITPFTKEDGKANEIEYSLAVNISG